MSLDMNALIRLMAQQRSGPAEPPARENLPSLRPLTDDMPMPPSEGGYRNPDMTPLPYTEAEPPLDYPPDDSPHDVLSGYGPDEWLPMRPAPIDPYGQVGGYDNYDEDAYSRWEQGVIERGNEVRETMIGTFEVAAGTNTILSKPPSPYRLD